MRRALLLFILLVGLGSCDSIVQLSAQRPRISPPQPYFTRVGLYLPSESGPERLLATINGEYLPIGDVEMVMNEAVHGSLTNALRAVSRDVIFLAHKPTMADMKQHDLDAAFWPGSFSARSQLEREGTLLPSYTSYSNVSLRIIRMGGFRGTIDSFDVTGFGSISQYRTTYTRARIAKLGAEYALSDLATKIVQKLAAGRD